MSRTSWLYFLSLHRSFIISGFSFPIAKRSCKCLSESPSSVQFSSVQSLSSVWLFVTPWTATQQASLFITNSWSLLKLKSSWVSDAIQPYHPLSSPSLPVLNLSQDQGFSNESVLQITWQKYWSFSFSISPFNEYPRLISFRIDWLDLLAVQGTLRTLLHHHSSEASILLCSAFFIVQLSHPYMTNGKLAKVMSLLFNMLSRLVIAFLPRSKCLLISWLQSPSERWLIVNFQPGTHLSLTLPSCCSLVPFMPIPSRPALCFLLDEMAHYWRKQKAFTLIWWEKRMIFAFFKLELYSIIPLNTGARKDEWQAYRWGGLVRDSVFLLKYL